MDWDVVTCGRDDGNHERCRGCRTVMCACHGCQTSSLHSILWTRKIDLKLTNDGGTAVDVRIKFTHLDGPAVEDLHLRCPVLLNEIDVLAGGQTLEEQVETIDLVYLRSANSTAASDTTQEGYGSMAGWKYRARFTVHASASVALDRINPAVGIVEAIDDETCVLGLDFTVTEPPELIAHLTEITNRYHRAVSPRADAVASS